MFCNPIRLNHSRRLTEKKSVTPRPDVDIWVEIDLNPEKNKNQIPKKETTRLISNQDLKTRKIFGNKSEKKQQEIKTPSSPKIPCSTFVRWFMHRGA